MSELHQAATKGDLKKVKKLLEQGADVNARDSDGRTPLHEAAYKDHLDVAKLLIEKGADVNARDGVGRQCRRAASGRLRSRLSRPPRVGVSSPILGSTRGVEGIEIR